MNADTANYVAELCMAVNDPTEQHDPIVSLFGERIIIAAKGSASFTAIDNADSVIVVMSPNSVNSKNLKAFALHRSGQSTILKSEVLALDADSSNYRSAAPVSVAFRAENSSPFNNRAGRLTMAAVGFLPSDLASLTPTRLGRLATDKGDVTSVDSDTVARGLIISPDLGRYQQCTVASATNPGPVYGYSGSSAGSGAEFTLAAVSASNLLASPAVQFSSASSTKSNPISLFTTAIDVSVDLSLSVSTAGDIGILVEVLDHAGAVITSVNESFTCTAALSALSHDFLISGLARGPNSVKVSLFSDGTAVAAAPTNVNISIKAVEAGFAGEAEARNMIVCIFAGINNKATLSLTMDSLLDVQPGESALSTFSMPDPGKIQRGIAEWCVKDCIGDFAITMPDEKTVFSTVRSYKPKFVSGLITQGGIAARGIGSFFRGLGRAGKGAIHYVQRHPEIGKAAIVGTKLGLAVATEDPAFLTAI